MPCFIAGAESRRDESRRNSLRERPVYIMPIPGLAHRLRTPCAFYFSSRSPPRSPSRCNFILGQGAEHVSSRRRSPSRLARTISAPSPTAGERRRNCTLALYIIRPVYSIGRYVARSKSRIVGTRTFQRRLSGSPLLGMSPPPFQTSAYLEVLANCFAVRKRDFSLTRMKRMEKFRAGGRIPRERAFKRGRVESGDLVMHAEADKRERENLSYKSSIT